LRQPQVVAQCGTYATHLVGSDLWLAEMARSHNDANVLSMGGRVVSNDLAEQIVKKFLETPFEGGRHARRVGQLKEIEAEEAARRES
ncbi:MAG: RpiB/LacA/LacB family sugar-phosphate isomerase, partial [Actinomycetota bacterium]